MGSAVISAGIAFDRTPFREIPRYTPLRPLFRQAWNHHPLSTEGNHTPVQLYAGGSIGSDLFDERDMDMILEIHHLKTMKKQMLSFQSLISLYRKLVSTASVDPLGEFTDNGIQFYRTCVRMVFQAMQSDGLL